MCDKRSSEVPLLAVVVVTWQYAGCLSACLSSVQRQLGVRLRLIVVDNGSTDGTVSEVRRLAPEAELVENERNLGFGAANNIGIELALGMGAEYVYLLNQDAWYTTEHDLADLVATQRRHPEFGILSPLQVTADEQHVEHGLLYEIWVRRLPLAEDGALGRVAEVYDLLGVQAAHWLVTRRCLERVGLFSPSFPHYGEDNNLAMRAMHHGFRVGLTTAVRAVHARAQSQRTPRQAAYMTYIGALSLLSVLPEKPEHVWGRILRNFRDSVRENGLPVLHLKYLCRLLRDRADIERNRLATLRPATADTFEQK